MMFLLTLIWLSAAGSLFGLLLFAMRRRTGNRIPSLFWHAAWILVFLRMSFPVSGIFPVLEALPAARPSAAAVQQAAESVLPAPNAQASVQRMLPAAAASIRNPAEPLSETERPDPEPVRAGSLRDSALVSIKRLPSRASFWFGIWLCGAVLYLLLQLRK